MGQMSRQVEVEVRKTPAQVDHTVRYRMISQVLCHLGTTIAFVACLVGCMTPSTPIIAHGKLAHKYG